MTSKYKVIKLESNKDDIKQPEVAGEHYPGINQSVLITGRSGSGKGVLLGNLLGREEFLKGAFDEVYLISESAHEDDTLSLLKLDDDHKIDDLDKAPDIIARIMETNMAFILAFSNVEAPKICIVLDDCVNHRTFLHSKEVKRLFVSGRHFNVSPYLLTQILTHAPRYSRVNAMHSMYFDVNHEEIKQIADLHTPGKCSKKDFAKMIEYATQNRFDFFYINKMMPIETRFRKNFDEILNLEDYKTEHSKRYPRKLKQPKPSPDPEQDTESPEPSTNIL